MPLLARRVLFASALSVGVAAATLSPMAAYAAPLGAAGSGAAAAGSGAQQPAQPVIVMLRNQHADLSIAKGQRSPRVDAAMHDQAPVIATAQRSGATNVRGFKTVNGFAAKATPTQIAQISADPTVAAVYPDLQVRRAPKPVRPAGPAPRAGRVNAAATTEICPSDPAKPLLEPEALQVTNTAFTSASTPQAQNLVTGAGVKVAWLADGIDINNPDFIRANGDHVFVDYQDFSGEGPDAPSSAAEAFGDASSIAAQGRQTYDLADYVSPAHPLPNGCNIQVRGMAPGASLVGLKVFGNAPTAPTSRFIEAIDYAVNVAGVDIINESFGANPFPDNGNDPISLADKAAVAAGVTVVVSSGDAGTNSTIGSPASSAEVIDVAATTTFQSYQQEGFAGVTLSNGTWASGNISSLSSGGITQQARVPDLSAPGDLGWAICSPNPDIYLDCTNNKGEPSPIQNFGGTSQSAPLTSGAAALVIEAYEKTHHGMRPAPALVKRLLTSTATDLGHPAYEQGAGQLNSLAAVNAALSWRDANGSPQAQGTALVVDKTQLSVIGRPGTTATSSLSVRNVSRNTQTVGLSTRTVGKVVSNKTGSVTLNTATAPTYIDSTGLARSYIMQPFSVPVGVDRLDVAIAVNSSPFAPRIILIDPHGTYQAYSIPQGAANFGHVDVHFPAFGTWSAFFALSQGSGFNGPIQYSVTTSDFTSYGSVSPSTLTLAPGESRSVTVRTPLPAQPGDVSASVQLSTALGLRTSVPVTARALIPTSAKSNPFSGVLTGGNGRGGNGGVAQSNVYYLDVPANKKDLGIGVTLANDPGVTYFGLLTAPDGQVYSYQSNQALMANGDVANDRSLQIYRRNPQAGRWTLSLDFTNPVSGLATQQKFTGTVAFDTVKIQASLPNSTAKVLKAGTPVDVPVKITNTGAAPLTYFADGRLNTIGDIPLAEQSGNATDIPLPVPPGVTPFWLVPPDTNRLTVAASATQPVNLDVFYQSGEPDVYAAAQGNGATVRVDAAQVSPGLWAADVGQTGPFAGPAPAGSVSLAAVARGQLFDPAITSSTGDVWQLAIDPAASPALAARARAAAAHFGGARRPGGATGPAMSGATARTGAARAGTNASTVGQAAEPTPVTLDPGQSVTITVTITPVGPAGSVVRGHLYIDTISVVTFGGDELIDLPYAYTVG
jgi:hypothetical protein